MKDKTFLKIMMSLTALVLICMTILSCMILTNQFYPNYLAGFILMNLATVILFFADVEVIKDYYKVNKGCRR
jgi:hypothetical protein